MTWLLKDLDSDDSFALEDGDVIGRSEGKHVFPDAAKMSRSHCQILEENGFLFIIDLGSRNGTYVNSVKCEPNKKALMTENSIIVVGDKTFILRKQADSTKPFTLPNNIR